MEQECSQLQDLSTLISSLTSHNIQLILTFLDHQTIISIIQAGGEHKHNKSRFISIANTKLFILNYLNKTDRSLYMPFYSQPTFLKIEHQQLSHLTTYSAESLYLLSDSCKHILRKIREQLEGFEFVDQTVDSLIQSLTDPELPFPKLRKQSLGRHCNSAFQFFLLDKILPSNEEEGMQETFQELDKFLSQRWSFGSTNHKQEIQIIQEVFSSWFKISYQNYQQYLLPQRTHHNLIVLIVALLDFFMDSFSFYAQTIQDPLYAFIEFNMRFSVFRNSLLSLEDKLSSLFKNYSIFCKEILKKKCEMEVEEEEVQGYSNREMTIWHCGLSKWYIYMQHHHQQYFKTFFYLLKKANLQNIKSNNYSHLPENAIYIEVQNRLELSEVFLLDRENVFELHSPIQDIFDQDPELANQVIKEYIEYIVDISINQYSVHWCGHSSHALHVPYEEFDALLVENYKNYIGKIQKIAKSVSHPAVAVDSMFSSMIEQLDRDYLKPVTLKAVIELVQKEAIMISGESKYESAKLKKTIQSINQEIVNRDSMLDDFNLNAGISNEKNCKYSIVLENEDFTKLLKTSASTNASYMSRGHNIKLHSVLSSDSILEEDFL